MVLDEPAPADTAPLAPVERDTPDPGADEVVLEVGACGVCRTDLQLVEGDLPARRLPVVPGPQVVGRIVATGEAVEDREAVKHVGVAWIASVCGTCRFCRSGRENLCESATFTGWDRDGGYADRVTARAEFTYPLPEAVDDLALAPLLCGGVIGYRCLEVAGVEPGDRLGLYGFGASASLVIQVARHWDCEVYVATRDEREQERARSMGAVWAGHYDETPPEPLDEAITFAPVGDVVVDALRAVDRGGVVAVNAIHLDRIPEFPYEQLWWERSIRSVANVTRANVTDFLAVAAEVPVTTAAVPYPLEQANDHASAIFGPGTWAQHGRAPP
ncbi:MAG: zinc-dependent alcohol dehydrogenase family protein [Acidimicrobiia bacterium]|nr:zinc-dependent alcohol dehydrogenase family protein [Acidimicrobiia bacterium]